MEEPNEEYLQVPRPRCVFCFPLAYLTATGVFVDSAHYLRQSLSVGEWVDPEEQDFVKI